MSQYYLAELNIARLKLPLEDPSNADFVAGLERINLLGETSPGFVWRLKDDIGGDATSIKVYDDPHIIVNYTIWESIEALFEFTYKSGHVEFFRQRKEWFEPHSTAGLVMWWVEAGYIPSTDEAKARLEYLQQHGATPYAFTFKQQFSVEDLLAWELQQAS